MYVLVWYKATETRLSTTPAGDNLFDVRDSPALSALDAKRFHSFVAKGAKTGRSCSERSRHIEIRYFWIHNFLTSRQVKLEHLHTDQMIADMFTKPLQGSKFEIFRFSYLNEK